MPTSSTSPSRCPFASNRSRTCLLAMIAASGLAATATVATAQPFNPASPGLRISQVYAFGGNTGSPSWRNDFIELHNPTQKPISASSYAVHYTSATSTATWSRFLLPAGTIAPGAFYLIQLPGGTNSVPPLLPTPDATGTVGLGTIGSKFAVVSSQSVAALTGANPSNEFIVDRLGTNSTATSFEIAPVASFGSLNTGIVRINSCVDTNNNSLDFTVSTPVPRNSAATAVLCAATPVDLTLVAAAAPTTITQIGTPVVYTIGVDNLGTDNSGAAGAVLTVVFPANIDYVSSSNPGLYDSGTRTLTIPLPSLEGAPFRVPVTINATAVGNGNNAVTASVAIAGEGNTSNNTALATVLVNEEANLGLTLSSSVATCTDNVAVGATLTYAVVVSNGGSANASDVSTVINLPVSGQYLVSSSATSGTLTPSGSNVTWSMPALANGATETATINVEVLALGVHRAAATVSSTTLDTVPANNSARVVNLSVSDALGFKTVINNDANSELSTIPAINATFSGTEAIRRPFPSPDGTKFIFRGTASGGTAADDVLITATANAAAPNFTVQVREATTDLGGEFAAAMDPYLAIDDAGRFAFSTNSDAAATADEISLVGDIATPGIFTVTQREGNAVLPLAPAAITYGITSNATGIRGGQGSSVVTLAGEGIVTTGVTANNSAVVTGNGASLPVQKGVTIPSNQLAGPLNATWSFIEGGGSEWRITAINDSATSIVSGRLNTGATSNDGVIVINDGVVMQEGASIPGATNTDPVLTFDFSNLEGDGSWSAYGRFGGISQQGWVVRNGQVVTTFGEPITIGSNETFTGSTVNPTNFTQTFFLAAFRGNDSVIGGVTTNPDAYRNIVLVHNRTTVIAREGDPIDLNGDGIANDDAFISTFRDDRAFISADRKLWTVVGVRDRAGTCAAAASAVPGTALTPFQALIVINLPPAAGGCSLADIVGGDGNPPADGSLDGNDFQAFLNAFGAGDALADIVGGDGNPPADTSVDGNDFQAFLNSFGAGC